MIAESYLTNAPNHNAENIGLEPVWPYDLIGDTSPLFALAKRTYEHRLYSKGGGWSFDPIQAARLDMAEEVKAALLRSTELSARCVNGFTGCRSKRDGDNSPADERPEFYIEQSSVAADAIQEALVQDYDGLIRIAPAVPREWNIAGSVFVHGRTKVDVQVEEGLPTTVVIESGIAQRLRVRNPWPGHAVDIIDGATGAKVMGGSTDEVFAFNAAAGTNYLLQRRDMPISAQPFAPISGSPASVAKRLGPVQLGLFGGSQ
jgi:hypothetical protein